MTNIHKKETRKRKASRHVCSGSVCSGSTKVNYYANANQRGTRGEKKRKGNNDFSPDCVTTERIMFARKKKWWQFRKM